MKNYRVVIEHLTDVTASSEEEAIKMALAELNSDDPNDAGVAWETGEADD